MAEFRINFVPQFLFLFLHPVPKFRNRDKKRRRVRVVEGARLESVYMGNCIMSSNLIVSAKKKNVKRNLDVFLFSLFKMLI